MSNPSAEHPPIEEYVTYEVTLPREAHEEALALQGLAGSFGWRVRERSALPSDLTDSPIPERWHVKADQLAQISTEVWGSDVYGRSAAAWHGISDNPNASHNRRHCYSVYESHFGTFFEGDMDPLTEETGLSFSELEGMVNARWARANSAHSLEVKQAQPGFTEPIPAYRTRLLATVGPVTRDRLANHLRTSGHDNHKLHGTLGKGLDVLRVAAGTTSPDQIGHSDARDMVFVTREEFEARLAQADLSNNQKRLIVQELGQKATWQLRDGTPCRQGELVFEGWFGPDPRGRQYRWTYDKVAVDSLHHLADALYRYPVKTSSSLSARRFLRSFV
jgi:hypothetical protein